MWYRAMLAATLCGAMVACSDDSNTKPRASASERDRPTHYIVSSVVFSPDDSQSTYVSVLDSLREQTIDYTRAVEIGGWGDVWVHEGFVYITNREESVVRKYTIEDGDLVELGEIGFTNFGEVDVAFWSNTFVAPDKAYMINGTGGYVIWDPLDMEITGEFDLPELPERDGFMVRAGTLDRSNVIRDGKLYQPMYWGDEDYLRFTPDSRVVVIDIESDSIDEVIDVPCAGLDIGSADDDGNLYFSTWTSGVFEPLLEDKPGNCVAKIAEGENTAEAVFTFAEVADGREGAAVRNFRDGRMLFSVFHDERVDFEAPDADAEELIADRNWRTWLYDPQSDIARVVESLDWNSGATYVYPVGDLHYVMVPSTDYASTTIVALDENLDTEERFELRGWGIRLFEVK